MSEGQEPSTSAAFRKQMNERKFICFLEQHLYGCLLLAKRVYAKQNGRKAFYKTEVDAFRRDLLVRRDINIEHKVDEDLFVCYLERCIRWMKRAVDLKLIDPDEFSGLLSQHDCAKRVRDFREHAERYASIDGDFWDGPGRHVNKYIETNRSIRSKDKILIGESWTYINGSKYLIGGILDFWNSVAEIRKAHTAISKMETRSVDNPIRRDAAIAIFHDASSALSCSVLETLSETSIALRVVDRLGVPIFQDLISELDSAEMELSNYLNLPSIRDCLGYDELRLAFDSKAHEALQGHPLSTFMYPPILFGNFGFRRISSQTDLESFVNEMNLTDFTEVTK